MPPGRVLQLQDPFSRENRYLDDTKRKEFRRLLTSLETQTQEDRMREREAALAKNRQTYRFQELKKAVILPTLREFMVDLDKKGHLTRLWEKSPEKIRFDVQIQTRVPKRGAVELSLSDTGEIRVNYGWSSGAMEQHTYALERIEAGFVADRVLHLLKGLVG
jgi:hypothetical protein